MTKPIIEIGASKESVKEARTGINDILKADVRDETKVAALTCLADLCKVNNTTVQNCTFDAS